jgi:predicted secreted hydrolase
LPARGVIRLGEQSFAVTGDAWCDREWSTSSLGEGQVGWDWFALQLTDGWDLMFYRLRRADGSTDRFSAGVAVPPEAVSSESGDVTRLGADDLRIEVLDTWTSPDGVACYPAAFRLAADDLDLRVVPVVADQEMTGLFRYWEGAVRVEGRHRGRPVEGRGYVELTGYAGR